MTQSKRGATSMDAIKIKRMKKEDAIKYLQQLYPNGGHCWLDEQRIEAIGMAINALQEEPVSKDLEEAANFYANTHTEWFDADNNPHVSPAFKAGANWQKVKDESVTEDLGEYINELSKQFPEVSFAKLSRITVRVAKWQEMQDQSTIELAEDHAYFAGRTKTIDEMMEKAIETTFNVSLPSSLYDKLLVKDCKEGDKLLVIKKDEL